MRRVALVVAVGVLAQGCTLLGAGIGALSASDRPLTVDKRDACIEQRARRQVNEPSYQRDCEDASTYPELRADRAGAAGTGALVGLALDGLAVLAFFVVVDSISTH